MPKGTTSAKSTKKVPAANTTKKESAEKKPAEFKKATIKNALITGGSGFAGSHVAKALLDRGCKVRVLDIVKPSFTHKNLEFVTGDLRNLDDMIKSCEGVDTVFHMAAIINLLGGKGVTKEYQERGYAINVKGSKNVFRR